VDDFIVNGDVPYTVSVSATGFVGLVIPDVQLTNLERDSAGILTDKASLTTTSAGGQDSFTVTLNSMPTSTVSIAVASSDPTEGTVTPTTPLVFTSANWSVPQTVTVTGMGVNVAYAPAHYSIILTVQNGSDPMYVALTTPPIQLPAANLHLETPPALPHVWGGSGGGGGCGLLGLELALPFLILRRRRAKERPL
jgi:hypothetical protein